MIFDQIMVDLETTGTNPNHNAMVQLSAVRFNRETREVDMNMFDQCLAIPANRYWSEDTRDWWATQDQSIIDKIWSRMRDPREVLQEFRGWAMRDLEGASPILWAKPIHFEYPFLESYFVEYGIAKPFHYSNCKDLRTFLDARGLPDLDRTMPNVGNAHDAIHDVLHQISVLFECLERTDVA
jgi:DNA polymerase III alpha subunit (gram-positive type)